MPRVMSSVVDSGPDRADPPARLASWYAPGLSDGLGDRLVMYDNTGDGGLELLRFKPEFAQTAAFVAALRARIEALSSLDHAALAKVRALKWLAGDEGLAIVSRHVEGVRLSSMIGRGRGAALAVELLRQISPALAALEASGDGIAHGLITPDRIIVTPDSRLVLSEYVLASAIEAMDFSPARLRAAFDLVGPTSDGRLAFDARTDISQLAFVALQLVIGRRVPALVYPAMAPALIAECGGDDADLRQRLTGLMSWFERALAVGSQSFANAGEARGELSHVLHDLTPHITNIPRAFGASARTAPPPASAFVPAPVPEARSRPEIVDPIAEPRAEEARSSRAIDVAVPASPVPPVQPELAPVIPIEAGREATARPLEVPPAGWTRVPSIDELTRPAPVEPPAAHYGPRLVRDTASALPPVLHLDVENEPPAQADEDAIENRGILLPRWVVASLIAAILSEGAVIAAFTYVRYATAVMSSTADTASVKYQPEADAIGGVETARRPRRSSSRGLAAGATAAHARSAVASEGDGSVRLDTTLNLQVLENGEVVGSSGHAFPLPAGMHELDLVNDRIGYHVTERVDVRAGHVLAVPIAAPTGRLSINAVPWADVTIDGKSAGETPLANLSVTAGEHQLVFRHPQFGERRQTVIVKADAPTLVSANLQR